MSDIFDEIEQAARDIQIRAPSNEASSYIGKLSDEAVTLLTRIAKGEELLKMLKERLTIIMTKELVEAMDAVNQDFIGVKDADFDIVVREVVKAALNKPDPKKDGYAARVKARDAGLAYLEKVGGGGLINTEMSLVFARGGEGKNTSAQYAQQLAAELIDRAERNAKKGQPTFTVEVDRSVHHGSLSSFVREQLEHQPNLKLPLLGAHVARVAEFKKKTGSRKKKGE